MEVLHKLISRNFAKIAKMKEELSSDCLGTSIVLGSVIQLNDLSD